MRIRFEVDQAESFRMGIHARTSVVSIDVNPRNLSEAHRNMIADRLDGIDVVKLDYKNSQIVKLYDGDGGPVRIKAKVPTWEAFMDAVAANAASIQNRKEIAKADEPGFSIMQG